MNEIRNRFGDLLSYEGEMVMTSAEAGPGDESRVTLESPSCSMPYRGERLIMDMADDDIRRHFGESFKVSVSPMEEELQCLRRDEPGKGVPAFADLCEDNAAVVAIVSCEDLKAAWSVGDELRMHLSASEDGNQPEQDVVWVVMGFDCKRVTDDKINTRNSRAVIGLKDGLEETMPGGTSAREWLGSTAGFLSMLPAWFLALLTTTVNDVMDGGGISKSLGSFWLPSETEVFGCTQYSDGELEEVETQLPYYAGRRDRRVKRQGIGGGANLWWERSPNSGYSDTFCYVNSDGSADWDYASNTRLLAPVGCF